MIRIHAKYVTQHLCCVFEEQYALNINVKIHYNTFSKYSDSSGRKERQIGKWEEQKERET